MSLRIHAPRPSSKSCRNGPASSRLQFNARCASIFCTCSTRRGTVPRWSMCRGMWKQAGRPTPIRSWGRPPCWSILSTWRSWWCSCFQTCRPGMLFRIPWLQLLGMILANSTLRVVPSIPWANIPWPPAPWSLGWLVSRDWSGRMKSSRPSSCTTRCRTGFWAKPSKRRISRPGRRSWKAGQGLKL